MEYPTNKLLLIFPLLILLACEPETLILDNPYDEENPDFVVPTVRIVNGPPKGGVIGIDTVFFSWTGNDHVTEFRYGFDDDTWDDDSWGITRSASKKYLDEGQHVFYLQGRYPTGDTSEIYQVNYVVDAVTGPALMFYPKEKRAVFGEPFTVSVLVEEVEEVTATEFSFEFDSQKIAVSNVVPGNFLSGAQSPLFFYSLNEDSSIVTISSGVVDSENRARSGTGPVAIIKFTSERMGESTLSFGERLLMRGPENQEIAVLQTANGVVKIE